MASMSNNGSAESASPDLKKSHGTGSELEIFDEQVKRNRDSLKIIIRRRYDSFGHTYEFSNSPESFLEILPYDDKAFSIHRAALNKGIQVTPASKENECQTFVSQTRNAWTHYEPRLFDEEDRNTILDSDSLRNFVLSSANSLERALQQQELVNVFREHDDTYRVKASARLKQTAEIRILFDEKLCRGKMVSCIEWHPRREDVVAIGYIDGGTYESKIDRMSSIFLQPCYVLLWEVDKTAGKPIIILESPTEVNCLKFHPLDHKYLIGGCESGFLVVWDISMYIDGAGNADSKVARWKFLGNLEDGHRHRVAGIYWLPGIIQLERPSRATTNEDSIQQCFFTVSIDGMIALWDFNDVSEENWKPIQKIKCFRSAFCWLVSAFVPMCEKSTGTENTTTAYRMYKPIGEEEINSVYFIIGCEDGNLIQWSWESYLAEAVTPKYLPKIHDGRICSVDRSPHFEHVWLAVGGHFASIWCQNSVIFTSSTRPYHLSDGHWSPSCPGTFFLLTVDGNVEIWATNVDAFAPIRVVKLSTDETLCMSVTHSYLCVGTRENGATLILESHAFAFLPLADLESLTELFSGKLGKKVVTICEETVKKSATILTLFRTVEEETEEQKLQKQYDSYLKLEEKMLAKIKDFDRIPESE